MKITTLVCAGVFAVLSAAPALADSSVPKPDQVTTCAACHGELGVSASPLFPNLAGQHRDYIIKALSQYKSGERKNAIMGAQAKGLSTDDMKALALWFSSQKPVLYTVDPEPKEGPAAATK
jgi:cytochrome c553